VKSFLRQCQTVCQTPAQFTWLNDETLTAAQVPPWTGLPLWIPESDLDFGGMLLADGSKASRAGLASRPWADTLRDTLDWAVAHADTAVGAACISSEVEAGLLAGVIPPVGSQSP